MLDLAFFQNKTILITGHTGFKGSWLCEILSDAGAKVIGYSLEPPTTPNLFGILELKNKITSIIGDIRDYEKLEAVFQTYRPDFVVHLAAQPIVLDSYKEPRYTFETNVMGTVNVLECTRKVGSVNSFLNVTTDKVYENNDAPCHLFKETEKLDGYDPYSNSKSCSELVTHAYVKSFFQKTKTRISTARAGNVIGGGDFANNRIIPDCYRAVANNRPIDVRNMYSTRPYQYVLEPLFCYLMILEKQFENPKYEGYYNVGPDRDDFIKTGDLVDMFCSKWGKRSSWRDLSTGDAPHEAACLALDNTLLKNTFGWCPSYHIDRTMDAVAQWYKSYYAGKDMIPITKGQIADFQKVFKSV